jgi:type II secretion system protein D
VPVNQRAIQYTLVKDDGQPSHVSATIGSAEQGALTVTIDPRTNSLLIGGTDHYVGLASEIISELDSSPAMERKTEVYRLRNSRAKEVELALRSFLDQDRQRITMTLGDEGLGTVQRLLEREVAIVAEPLSNTLLLSASPRYFDQFKALIEELDQPQPQVLIQVILAEVTLDKTTELGVEWAMQQRIDGNKIVRAGTGFGVADEARRFGGFSSSVTGDDFSFILRALESDGRLEVLSRPQILTADNQQATIDIGQRVPLITDSRVTERGDTINSFRYENVGVSLTVTPRISPDGFVKMDVEPTISQISSANINVSPGVTQPIINERKATTTVSVQNGQSVIIGGLISTTDDQRVRKVPVLGNIPYLGALFRSTKTLQDRKELLIILTPQLLQNQGEAQAMTENQLRRTTIKDQLKRDKLQQEILDPLLPIMDEGEPLEIEPTKTPGPKIRK